MRLQDRNARQLATIRELQKRLVEAQRAVKRQAAPFSKGDTNRTAQASGQKAGHGPVQLPKATVCR